MYRSKWIVASCVSACGLGLGLYYFGTDDTPSPAPSSQQAAPALVPSHPSPVHFVDSEQETKRRSVSFSSLTDSDLEEEATRPIRHVVQVDRGDTLMDLLLKSGVETTDATKAIDALRDVYNPRRLKVGQEVVVTFERPRSGIGFGPFSGISLKADPARTVYAQRTTGVSFNVTEQKHETTRQVLRYEGVIQSSLFQSGSAAGIPTQVLIDMIRAMSYDVDFQREIQPGDAFEAVFERHIDKKGNAVQDGTLLYASMKLKGNVIAIYHHTDASGDSGYYSAKGESVRKALLRTPVDGARISSGFGMRRHPVLGYSKAHKGVDFAVPTGTPIMAAGDAIVEMAGWNGSYGNYVRLRHTAQHSTAYAHMSRIAVKKGQKIRQGQTVGYVGSTGRSTGPHLHYEILANGVHVNPLGVKFKSGTSLAGKELQRFQQDTVKKIEALRGRLPSSSRVASLSK